MRKIRPFVLALAFMLLHPLAALAAPGGNPNGQPFQNLQGQIDSLPSGGGFVVVDSIGKKVGGVVGLLGEGGHTNVAFELNGQLYVLELLRNSYKKLWLFYPTTDCTGQAFGGGEAAYVETRVAGPGNTLYAESGPQQTVTPNSQRFGNFCWPKYPSTQPMTPMSPVIDLDDEFIPPFTLMKE